MKRKKRKILKGCSKEKRKKNKTDNEKKPDESKPNQPKDENEPTTIMITEYFVNVSSILTYSDGRMEKKTWEYPVREIEEREDTTARKNEERYQLAIKVGKRKEVYLYLNRDRTVSSFEADEMLYLMRGH